MSKTVNKKVLLIILLICGYSQITLASTVPQMPEIIITTTNNDTWPMKKMNQYNKKYKKNIPLIFNAYEYTLGGAIVILYEVPNHMYLGIEYKQFYKSTTLSDKYYYGNEYINSSNGLVIISINIKF